MTFIKNLATLFIHHVYGIILCVCVGATLVFLYPWAVAVLAVVGTFSLIDWIVRHED